MKVNDDNETRYRVTPKGFLAGKLMEHKEIDSDKAMEMAIEIWYELRKFVKETSESDGYVNGIPTLVFDNGGQCIKVFPQHKMDSKIDEKTVYCICDNPLYSENDDDYCTRCGKPTIY